MNEIDELDNWKWLLEKANECGFAFDKEIVSKMVKTIEEQAEKIERYEKLMSSYGFSNKDNQASLSDDTNELLKGDTKEITLRMPYNHNGKMFYEITIQATVGLVDILDGDRNPIYSGYTVDAIQFISKLEF